MITAVRRTRIGGRHIVVVIVSIIIMICFAYRIVSYRIVTYGCGCMWVCMCVDLMILLEVSSGVLCI